ncbi:cytochrome P450 2J6-like [Chelonoidis abingdonii]|uniref:cytochrome P450 2J6-like n=1 Tax=Chelonoidis abingdonii TaxID=106734 RepID=UPI0013F209F6|nr:cytochrome P450 2J6-like [Chelonoidis abingdonii]
MLTIYETLIGLVVFLLIVQFLKLQWAHRHLPPGPTPFPILGSLWQMNFKVDHDSFNKMAEVYGNIFTLWLGHTPGVVLHGFQAVKDGLNTHLEEFSGQLKTPFFKRFANGKGITFSSGHIWKQQRRFGLMTLRKLGLGKKGLEHRIQEEARHLVEYFETVKGKSLDPSVPIVHAVSNVICAVVFGHRFSLEDETFHQLTEAFNCIFAFVNSFHFFLFEILPWLMHHLPGPQQKVNSCCEFVRSFIRKEIRSHKERGIPDEPQDFIDFYLAQIAKAKNDPASTYDEDNMNQSIFDLFLAGTETTATTLRWALLYMVAYPDIQEKVQKELDTVLGPFQLICYEDRKNLPYTNAVIHEIQRYCSIILITIPRESGKDTTLQGFPIPKGTLIVPNLDSVLFDPEKWESPRQFNPSRFLDKEGNFMIREAFLPFLTGSRVCLEEQLARSELFIFFANLLRAFTFTLPKGVKEISTKLVVRITMQPEPYELCVVPR